MRTLITLALVAGLAPFASAQVVVSGMSTTATAPASVTIMQPITLSICGSLNFGRLIVLDPTQTASVSITSGGSTSYTNSVAYTGNRLAISTSVPTFTANFDPSDSISLSYKATGLPVQQGQQGQGQQGPSWTFTPDSGLPSGAQGGTLASTAITGKLQFPGSAQGTTNFNVQVTATYL